MDVMGMMLMRRSRAGAGGKLDRNLVRKLDLGLRHGPLSKRNRRELCGTTARGAGSSPQPPDAGASGGFLLPGTRQRED